jgi:hypothetical protein
MATDLPHLLLTVLPFALASMLSLLTIIIVMAVLSATKRRALKAVLFAITYATVFSAICLLLVAVGSAATIGGNPSSAIAGNDVFLGVILLYIVGRSLTKGVGTPLVRSFDPGAMSVAAAVSLGVLFRASNFSSLIPALAASKDTGVAAVPPFDKTIAFVFLLVIALSWVWAPVVISLRLTTSTGCSILSSASCAGMAVS